MAINDPSALRIYRGQRKYDDELPLNRNTPDFNFHRPIDDPAPYIVVVQGPRNVGKSLLIRSLVKRFETLWATTRCIETHCGTTLSFTTASGKDIRLQFVECPDDINGMVDAAKYADVAILMVDASYGFEMETFEFRNLLQVHGFPKVIGVLTHLDQVHPDEKSKVRKRLEDHFCTEIYEGAKLFSFDFVDGLSQTPEIDDLGEMLSDSQFLPSSWRAEHPYVLADHVMMNVTDKILIISGYLRGCDINQGAKVHVAGAGDCFLVGVTRLSDDLFGVCKTGTYLQLDVQGVTNSLNFDNPILVGGVLEEEKSGFMMVKLRRHSWHMNLLQSGAPITVSAGWRRYQTNAIYAMENKNGQHQLLKYTPEHKDCVAVFWGPLAPPKTRIVAVLNKFHCLKNKEAFRVMAKGLVLDFNQDAQILLKGKRIATPTHISWKTAYIRLAPKFALNCVAEKVVGAPIQTSSGIQGKIDEAVGNGIVKCTFKDNIPMGDTFLFPVLARLVLPSLFKQLEKLFKPIKHSENAVDISATIDTALDDTFTAFCNAYIGINCFHRAYDVKEPAVSYKEVAPSRQMLDQRRGVVIHEGRCRFVSLPNLLELKQKAIRKRKREDKEKHSFDRSVEGAKEEHISGEVKDKHSLQRSGEEAMVIGDDYASHKKKIGDDYAVRFDDTPATLFVRRYGKQLVGMASSVGN